MRLARLPRIVWALIAVMLAAVALVVPLVAIGTSPVPGPVDASAYQLPPDDVSRLNDLSFGAPPPVAISQPAALAAAEREYDSAALGADGVAAYLAAISVPGSERWSNPIVNRPVWVVRMTGLSGLAEGPPGTDAAPPILTRAYVFIDAETGEFMFTEWQE